jgi:hypothetical protein
MGEAPGRGVVAVKYFLIYLAMVVVLLIVWNVVKYPRDDREG